MTSSAITRYILLDEVSILIHVDTKSNFKPKGGENWGYIEIKPIHTDSGKGECFWDNIDFFLNPMKEITADCKDELIEKRLYEKGILKVIKKQVKEIKKLGYLK